MAANRSGVSGVRAARRSTNVSLNRAFEERARVHDNNLSQASERNIAEPLAGVRTAQWLEENRAALDSCNAYVEAHGLPLAKYRLF